MKGLKNFHTHCSFCDGKNTPEEMIEAAISKGFSTLGFSSHIMFPEVYDGVTLTPNNVDEYVDTIRSLAEKYKDRIEILCGIEADYIKGVTDPDASRYAKWGFDYIIGSIHFLTVDGDIEKRLCIDESPEVLKADIDRYFDGYVDSFLIAYFTAEREMVLNYDFNIVGHPDLPRKFNAGFELFEETAPWYIAQLDSTAKAIAQSGKIVEINTGAISRGWQDNPYPSETFTAFLKNRNVPLIISSDAHAASGLDCAFDKFASRATITDFR